MLLLLLLDFPASLCIQLLIVCTCRIFLCVCSYEYKVTNQPTHKQTQAFLAYLFPVYFIFQNNPAQTERISHPKKGKEGKLSFEKWIFAIWICRGFRRIFSLFCSTTESMISRSKKPTHSLFSATLGMVSVNGQKEWITPKKLVCRKQTFEPTLP